MLKDTEEPEATQDNPTAQPVYDSEMYKGYNMIVLNKEEKYPFQFGLGKAKLILANIDKIQAFVAHEEMLKKNAPKPAAYQRSFKPKGDNGN